MKIKVISIFILICLFSLFLVLKLKSNSTSESSHKILRIVNAGEFYIDLNDNNAIDHDELFKLKNVTVFLPYKNSRTNDYIKYKNLTLSEYLISGYIASNWARDNLLNKNVTVKNIEKFQFSDAKYANIFIDNQDVAKLILEFGFGLTSKNNFQNEYFQYDNIAQIKNNVKAMEDKSFVILNKKNNIFHKLDCSFANLISNGEILSLKELKKDYIPCKVCLDQNKQLKNNNVFLNLIPKNKKVYKKSVYKNFSGLELYLINPHEYKKPNMTCSTQICKRLITEINGSTNTIDLALYSIGSQSELIEALKNAEKRGVKIRVVLDKSKENAEVESTTKNTFIQYFNPIQDGFSSSMHNKFIIFDNKKVFTGSTNITSTGIGGYNANIAAIINSSAIAEVYKKEFENMYNGKFSKAKKLIETSEVNLSGTKIQPYFSPKSDIYENLIMKNIKDAKKEIFISTFYLTDDNLINELILAKQRGVNVLILIDAVAAINFKEKLNKLRNNKIPVIVENWGGKNHEKTIVIDSEKLIFGSCNFSKSGFYKNDENIILVKNSEIASFYRDYYLYLFNSIDKKYLNSYIRAESFDSINSCYDGIDNNFDGKIDFEDSGCKK